MQANKKEVAKDELWINNKNLFTWKSGTGARSMLALLKTKMPGALPKNFKIHDTRRLAAQNSMLGGGLQAAMNTCNHSKPEITMAYLNPVPHDMLIKDKYDFSSDALANPALSGGRTGTDIGVLKATDNQACQEL